MPTIPKDNVIEACKRKLNPKDVLSVIISETPELRVPLVEKGIVKEKE